MNILAAEEEDRLQVYNLEVHSRLADSGESVGV
jgi:hypothetical protein